MDGVEEGRTERIMLQRASAHWNAHKLRAALGQWRHELEGSKGLVQRATVICARLLNSVLVRTHELEAILLFGRVWLALC
jgi:hypothetical protein